MLTQISARGCLSFQRRPNYITSVTLLVLSICLIWVLPGVFLNSRVMFFVILVPTLLMLRYVLKQMTMLRNGNEIVLTADSFIERNRGLFGKTKTVTIPLRHMEAIESGSSEPGLISSTLALLFTPGDLLVVKDRSNKTTREYRTWTIKNYKGLRSALTSRVGLTKSRYVTRYE